jgi:hypothetical protein
VKRNIICIYRDLLLARVLDHDKWDKIDTLYIGLDYGMEILIDYMEGRKVNE